MVSFVVLMATVLFVQSPAKAGTLYGPYQVLAQGASSVDGPFRCMNVPNGTLNPVTLIIYTCHNPARSNDQFWAEDLGGGDWEIWNVGNGMCLTVLNALETDNAPVIQHACTGEPNEVWHLTANYTIVNKKSKKCLTVKNEDSAPGTELLQFRCNGKLNQEWSWATQWGDR
ncbi:RICIN domain-containing protein [Micromonospora sp. NPDC049102]|uniref:RICIN domain-containing protein n=1 Tax=Micromonospora sp. NPDC049102 TaxID=3364265 RepID=UPI00371A9918